MARQHSPLQQFREAKQIAADYGMFVSEKPNAGKPNYLLYRRQGERPVYLGRSSTAAGLRRLVCRCANIK